jgi:hypothetical protein
MLCGVFSWSQLLDMGANLWYIHAADVPAPSSTYATTCAPKLLANLKSSGILATTMSPTGLAHTYRSDVSWGVQLSSLRAVCMHVRVVANACACLMQLSSRGAFTAAIKLKRKKGTSTTLRCTRPAGMQPRFVQAVRITHPAAALNQAAAA